MGHAEKIWLLLVTLTGASTWLAETGNSSWALTLVVAGLIALKGRLVIDHYMEMIAANRKIRRVLYAFATIVPLLVVFNHGWSDILKRITTIN